MAKSIKRLFAHPKYEKLFNWGRLITVTAGAQGLIQIAGLVSGIMILRLLPTNEYALYTLSNAILGTMTMLSDGGIGNGVMSQGGKVWTDRNKLGVVLATGLNLRKKFAIASLIIAIPALVYLLLQHKASNLTTFLIVLSLIPAFYAALSDSLYEIIPKLHQDVGALQENQIKVSIGRLVLSVAMLFFFPLTYIAIFAAGIPRIIGNLKLKRLVYSRVTEDSKPNLEVRNNILSMVKKTLPTSIYYSISGQITIWVISFFGQTLAIAQIGALGRVSMLLTLFGTMVGILNVPRFSRLPESRKILTKYSLMTIGTIIVCCFLVLLLVSLFSNEILWVLGKQYAGLKKELLLSVFGSSITLISGTCYVLYSSRGWQMSPTLVIIIDVLALIIGLFFFKVSTLTGVLYYSIFTASILLVINSVFIIYKIRLTNNI